MSQNVVLNWSSGKDAALAYHLLTLDSRYKVTHLLTTLNAEVDRVFMHGTSEDMLEAQASRLNLPLIKVKLPPSPDDSMYKEVMHIALTQLGCNGVRHAAYGDIFLEDLKAYRETQLATIGYEAVFPLWKKDTRSLVQLVQATGIEAIVVCVNSAVLGKEFLGRKIDSDLLNDLPDGVDPCGENGEFHTCVVGAPFFSDPIPYRFGETIFRTYSTPDTNTSWDTGFYFLDVICK